MLLSLPFRVLLDKLRTLRGSTCLRRWRAIFVSAEFGHCSFMDANMYSAGAVAADLPSKEGPNERLGTTDGVGALPGSSSEASVAKLPDERFEGE